MALQTQQRWMLIGGALLLTLVAMVGLQEQENESAPEITMQRHVHTSPNALPRQTFAANAERLPDLSRQAQMNMPADAKANADANNADLFQAHAWYVPPPPKPVIKQVIIEKPTAPPVPYTYMGKMENSPQGTLFFLSANNKVQLVKPGQTIDNLWKLDKDDANTLYFTYIPLGLPQRQSKSAKPAARNFVPPGNETQDVDVQNQNLQNQDLQNADLQNPGNPQ